MSRKIKKIVFYSLTILIVGLIYYLIAEYSKVSVPCIFYKATGLYCPGCGVTRMFKSILHFDVVSAFKSNQVAFIFLPFGIFLYIKQSYLYVKYGKTKFSKLDNAILMTFIICLIIFGVLRNVQFFEFLRPG